MKKCLLLLLVVLFSVLSPSANAQLPLPPFKADVGKSAKKTLTTVQTRAQDVAKKIQNSSFVQQAIAYGKGAKEAVEFSKKFVQAVKDFSLDDLINMGKSVGNFAAQTMAAKKEAKEKAALEINAKTKANEVKIAELRENNNKLRKEIVEDPDKKKKNERKIKKNEKEIAKLSKKSKEIADKVNKDLAAQLGSLDAGLSNLRNSTNEMISSFKTIGVNFDPTAELKKAATGLMPGDDVEDSARLLDTYRKMYLANYYSMLAKVIARTSLLKSEIENDNETSRQTNEGMVTLEGQTPAITTLVTLKAQNTQALLNYTELLLLRLQLDMAYDLAETKFARVSVAKTIEEFNFDNYRLPVAKTKLKELKKTKFGGGNVEKTFSADHDDPTRMVIIEAVQDFERTEKEFRNAGEKKESKDTAESAE